MNFGFGILIFLKARRAWVLVAFVMFNISFRIVYSPFAPASNTNVLQNPISLSDSNRELDDSRKTPVITKIAVVSCDKIIKVLVLYILDFSIWDFSNRSRLVGEFSCRKTANLLHIVAWTIQKLYYSMNIVLYKANIHRFQFKKKMHPQLGIEPTPPGFRAVALTNYTTTGYKMRMFNNLYCDRSKWKQSPLLVLAYNYKTTSTL